jgi:hypothetical protein
VEAKRNYQGHNYDATHTGFNTSPNRNSSASRVSTTNQSDIADRKREEMIVKEFALFAVSPDQNTGYTLAGTNWLPMVQAIPEPIKQIMSSFELVEK